MFRFFIIVWVVGFSASAIADWRTVNLWNEAARSAIASPGGVAMGPPQSARVLAIIHSCMYDAWTIYDSKAKGRFFNTNGSERELRSDKNKRIVTSYAAYLCLKSLFPADLARKNQEILVQKLLSTAPEAALHISNQSLEIEKIYTIAEAAAQKVLTSYLQDGSNEVGNYLDNSGYESKNKLMSHCIPNSKDCVSMPRTSATQSPNTWQPLINSLGKKQFFITPQWSSVVPFALQKSSQFDDLVDLSKLPKFGSSQYREQNDRAIAFSKNITKEQKAIVEYWADGPDTSLPPGHWGIYTSFVAMRDQMNIDDAIKLHFVASQATFDAGIVIWHLKRKFDYVRPITSVRYERFDESIIAWGGPDTPCIQTVPLDQGGCYARLIKGKEWSPYNPGSNLTPAFPEFPSGHSGFSSAAATVLELQTKNKKFGMTDCFDVASAQVETSEKGIFCWNYPTYQDAAQQAADSRELGGIHFAYANIFSLRIGKTIGQQVFSKATKLFNGE
jgi:hypothetical protein